MVNLPAWFRPDNSHPLVFDDTGTARTVEPASGVDLHGYFDGDVPSSHFISAGSGYVFITGHVGANTTLSGRMNMFCAKSVDPKVKVNTLLIVGDTCDENAALEASMNDHQPYVLIVPEASRSTVFQFLATSDLRANGFDTLKSRLVSAFPRLAMKLYYLGETATLPSPGTGRSLPR